MTSRTGLPCITKSKISAHTIIVNTFVININVVSVGLHPLCIVFRGVTKGGAAGAAAPGPVGLGGP